MPILQGSSRDSYGSGMGAGWVAGDPTIELPGISLEKGKEGGKVV